MSLKDDLQLKGSIESEGIQRENALVLEEWAKPSEVLEMGAFWGSVGRDMRDSVMGTAAWSAGLWFSDQCHRYNTNDFFEHYERALRYLNTQIDGEPVRYIMADLRERMFDFTVEHQQSMGSVDVEKAEEWTEENLRYMLWSAWFYAGQMEREVKEVIERDYGVEVLALSRRYNEDDETAINEVTPYERPEARGIDLYVPEWDAAIQVKCGAGGELQRKRDKIEADIEARVMFREGYTAQVHFRRIKD